MPRLCVTLALFPLLMATAAGQTSRSSDAARALVQALTNKHLDAVATLDPTSPGRFIAAMYFAPSQLLVVRARHPSVDALTAAIHGHRYRDVYLDLQTAPTTSDKLFVHDIWADGLIRTGGTIVDNVYQDGVRAALAKKGTTGRFDAIDGEYERMLRALKAALDQ